MITPIINLINQLQMKTALPTLMFLFLFTCLLASHSQAEDKSTAPLQFNLSALLKASIQFYNGNSEKVDRFLRKLNSRNHAQVCVCEILDLENNNNQYSGVALFSQKTNTGDLGREYRAASKVIEQEARHMKEFFFDRVKVTKKIAANTDCISLYWRMNSLPGGVKMFDIIDADIRSASR